MVANKNRLYVAVYPSDETPEDQQSFNWGFLVGPKTEDKVVNPGMRYHVERVRAGTPAAAEGKLWRYAETVLPSVSAPARMYARVLVAKIDDDDALVALLRATQAPPRIPGDAVAMARRAAWSSRLWVAEVLRRLAAAKENPVTVAVAVAATAEDEGRRQQQRQQWWWWRRRRQQQQRQQRQRQKYRSTTIVGTAVLDWLVIEPTAREFVAGKMADQRYGPEIMQLPKPTWDMLLEKETAP